MSPQPKKRSKAAPSGSPSSGSPAALILLLLLVVGGAFIPGRWIRDASTMGETSPIIMARNLIINPIVDHQTPPSPPQSLPSIRKAEQAPAAATTNQTTMSQANPIVHLRAPPLQPLPSIPEPEQAPEAIVPPFACLSGNQTGNEICRSANPLPIPAPSLSRPHSSSCPDYFRWIHEDLRPWKSTGITRKMVERARRTANFRLVVLNGKAYVQRYCHSFQTRDVFTIWGILQLFRRYPGRIPDLDLMFDCVDWPIVRASDYRRRNASAPPPLFRYCGDESTLDIVFPDWSFWGWAEINIKPWEVLRSELKDGNDRVRWMDREPYAYWKGNPAVATTRQDLLRCNVSESHDWNARLYAQDWLQESREGFKESDLANQCIHRYKIYIEGSAWSVSEKYILACDSLTLLVTPKYHDFFTRGLMPLQHYWPIRDDDKCRSIKFAVDWGNSHKQKAQAIGKEASNFILEKVKMDCVYDYMFHLLNEYAKLLRYKPTIPEGSVELCAESMACSVNGLEKKFMTESLVRSASNSSPCMMPPPYSTSEVRMIARRKANTMKKVEMWEQRARESKDNNV
ncbi:hypothetical protein OPV22_007166 [Ensete ventricosum]|uniref:Glycosyl transferase CAP10 domain-containing protein n=1 Tax=Ensete ventricosum TaxID=4639 RepID=A0AAV8RUE3_ENSVE|nr:hypothetical protein OPV22_007166 [Ensete ventricosum]